MLGRSATQSRWRAAVARNFIPVMWRPNEWTQEESAAILNIPLTFASAREGDFCDRRNR